MMMNRKISKKMIKLAETAIKYKIKLRIIAYKFWKFL